MEGIDPKGRCNYCNVYAGRDKVKTCSRCRLVRYCSKECQVAAWKTHKQRCTSTLPTSLAKDPEASILNTALSKWINNWRFELHNWAVWAMDLANNPEDRLATHSLVIELERRPNPQNQSLYFKMRGGDIMTRERFLARLRALDELNDEFVASVNEQRNNDTAQIIVVCEDLVRLLWFSIRDGGASLRQRDPAFSRALSQDWERGLIKAINTGQPASSGVHSLTAKSKVTPSA
ncbi:hypothetical protein HD554DRAFT_2171095 [Boletus coccyginus]|nr:hypothetical protein HD554DRAFT_2171095 [Boletus coccyginus]